MKKTLCARVLNPDCDNQKSKIQNRKLVGIVALVVTLAMWGAVATAQQPARIHRIGILSPVSRSVFPARVEAFLRRLRELGYVEGKNIVIEYRFTEGNLDRLAKFIAEFVRLNVDVIVTGGAGATRVAKEATVTNPIVMAQDPDPIGNGFIAYLARPGGNITGLSVLSPELSGKQLELLKEIVPKLFRVAVR